MKYAITALAVVVATPVSAQQVDPGVVRACYQSAAPGQSAPPCLGQAVTVCVGPNSLTPWTSACIQAETAVWDQLLNEVYGAVRSDLRAQGGTLADQLLQAQRAWITYRDAECALEYARWAGGSIRTIVAANCMMLETAERAIELRDKLGN